MDEKDCKHKNIEIWRVSSYKLPTGYEEFMEQEDIDLGKQLIEEYQERVVCQDCGKVID